ncbi:MAG: anthranilate synthase component I family protein, partial [Pseudomonadota bacterium]
MERIEARWRHPLIAFKALEGQSDAHLLHPGNSSVNADYSYIVAFPRERIVSSADDQKYWRHLVEVVESRKMSAHPGAPPLVSGLVGYVGYEAVRAFEPSLQLPGSPYALPDCAFGVYDGVCAFDRNNRKLVIYGKNSSVCDELYHALENSPEASENADAASRWSIEAEKTQARFEADVADVIERILDGEVFQANIAHRLCARRNRGGGALDLLERISSASDAEFGALLQYDSGSILSNSPERFFRITSHDGERTISTEPIKGTRPRSSCAERDQQMAEQLLADPKDRAENIMIVDLLRNDLSKICDDHSIRVPRLCELMSLSKVHHLVSQITGTLRNDVSVTDVFGALFPCGSITGAPKVQAMKVISEIEGIGRGPYCGAIGYISDTGVADFSVAIRTTILAN